MRKYNDYLNQAFNLKNFDINGKIKYQTPYQQALELAKEVNKMIENDAL